ncbi:spore germination protein [Paenibacillus sp. WC2504]|uniref:spore germination protein n=1 Tax=Paenibacillus sp. WC2504 TaxID=3461403 RepID=UPI00404614CB
MPSVVYGGVKILSVNSGSNVQFGDTALIRLSSNSKIYAGANSFSPGDSFGSVQNVLNGSANTSDPDLIDTNTNNVL